MTEYTPTTEEVRSLYESGAWLMTDRAPNKFDQKRYEGMFPGEFDRWLNEIRAEAWEEGAESAFYDPEIRDLVDYPENPYRNPAE